jgi:hypothetical protein
MLDKKCCYYGGTDRSEFFTFNCCDHKNYQSLLELPQYSYGGSKSVSGKFDKAVSRIFLHLFIVNNITSLKCIIV